MFRVRREIERTFITDATTVNLNAAAEVALKSFGRASSSKDCAASARRIAARQSEDSAKCGKSMDEIGNDKYNQAFGFVSEIAKQGEIS